MLTRKGKPLVPTGKYGTVRWFLKMEKAIAVSRCPVTNQWCYEPMLYTQPITLGIDTGTKTTGVPAVTEKKEWYAAEMELWNDIPEMLATRRECC
jgi:hypothetical protein